MLCTNPKASPLILAHFCDREKELLSKEPLKRSRAAARARLQQVHTTVVQEVGCALGGGPHHLLLADHLDRLVVDAQPAVEPDLEDVRGVVAARGAAAVVVDHCKRGPGAVRAAPHTSASGTPQPREAQYQGRWDRET